MNHGQRLALWRDTLAPGSVLRCVENTKIPDRAGLLVAVDSVGGRTLRVTVVDDPAGRLDPETRYVIDLPKLARDLDHVSSDRIRFRIKPGLLVEWEKV